MLSVIWIPNHRVILWIIARDTDSEWTHMLSAAIRASWLPHTFTPYCLRHLGTLCWSQYSSQLYSQRINGFLASYSPDSNTRSNNFNTIFWIRCEKLKPCWQRKLAPGRTKLMTAWPTEKCRSSSLRLTCHSLHMFKSDKIFVLFRHHFGLISKSTSTHRCWFPTVLFVKRNWDR